MKVSAKKSLLKLSKRRFFKSNMQKIDKKGLNEELSAGGLLSLLRR
jgi:hypothetical protein